MRGLVRLTEGSGMPSSTTKSLKRTNYIRKENKDFIGIHNQPDPMAFILIDKPIKPQSTMKLIVKCKECREENIAPNEATDRINSAKKFGDDFNLKCNNTRAVEYSLGEIILNRLIVIGSIGVITIILKIVFWSNPISWIFLVFPIATLFFFKTNDSKKRMVGH